LESSRDINALRYSCTNACRPGFFLPVRVLSRLFRRLFLDKLTAAYDAGHLHFFGDHAGLAKPEAFGAYLTPLRRTECVTGGWSVSTNADELRGGGATNSTEDVRT
jgi:hypothetical protein